MRSANWFVGVSVTICLAVVTGACGPGDQSDRPNLGDGGVPDAEFGGLVKYTGALTGEENLVTISPGHSEIAGERYLGQICIENQGCQSNGQSREYALADGTHVIYFPYSSSLGAPTPAATITVSNQGTALSINTEAEKYLEPPPPTEARKTTLTTKLVTVAINRGEFNGFLDLYGAGTFVGDDQAALIPSRIYDLYTAYASPLEGDRWEIPFSVHPDGHVSVDQASTQRLILPGQGAQSNTLIAQTVSVKIDRNGFLGALHGYSATFVNDEAKLLKARIHTLYTPYASPLPGEDWAIPFTVHADGHISVDSPHAQRIIVVGQGEHANTLIAQNLTVKLNRSNFAGHLDMWTGGFVNDQAKLLKARIHYLYTVFAAPLPDQNWQLPVNVHPGSPEHPNGHVTVTDANARLTIREAAQN